MASPDDYFNDDAESLLGRVDFAGLVGDFTKASVSALLSVVTVYFLAVEQALTDLLSSIRFAFSNASAAITPGSVMKPAIEAAGQSIDAFDLFGLPASFVVPISVFIALSIITYLFFPWGDG